MQTTTTHQPPNGLITSASVAEQLGLPVDAVRGWVRRGRVSSVRFGSRGKLIGPAPPAISQLRRDA